MYEILLLIDKRFWSYRKEVMDMSVVKGHIGPSNSLIIDIFVLYFIIDINIFLTFRCVRFS